MSLKKLASMGALTILAASALADHHRGGCGSWHDGYASRSYYGDPYQYRDRYYDDYYYSTYRPHRYVR
jgi:hypothetical protein